MRLWTLHPQYLDRQGLVAVWREGLLAKRVLEQWIADPEQRFGYRNHPQLDRFKATSNPTAAISIYLAEILVESKRRNYQFSEDKIMIPEEKMCIQVTTGQIEHERQHLLKKLSIRNPNGVEPLQSAKSILLHPMFIAVPGEIEMWEKQT